MSQRNHTADLLFHAYQIMLCNDPGQPLLVKIHEHLKETGQYPDLEAPEVGRFSLNAQRNPVRPPVVLNGDPIGTPPSSTIAT